LPPLYVIYGSGVSLTDPGHGFSLVEFETNTQGVALGTSGRSLFARADPAAMARFVEAFRPNAAMIGPIGLLPARDRVHDAVPDLLVERNRAVWFDGQQHGASAIPASTLASG
jgi:hypothetical protein